MGYQICVLTYRLNRSASTLGCSVHEYLSEYPPAPPDRIAAAERLFPYRSLSPEQYFAAEGHKWDVFSFDDYIYPDPQLNEWIHSLGDLFAKNRGALG